MNTKLQNISDVTINRLSLYLRCLITLEDEGTSTVSSQELARRFHLNSAQIRKDLAYFGEFGVRGVGYNVPLLREHLQRILGLTVEHSVVIVGAGHLGQAIAGFKGFNTGGFKVVGLFDTDPKKIGHVTRKKMEIKDVVHLKDIIQETGADIGVIAVHPESAQDVYDRLTSLGIKAILNFAPKRIQEKIGVRLEYVDMKIFLETLSYYLIHDTGSRRKKK
ncbi:MAG TPA: redox-sensing transcriptional repressor Rex [Thermoanaerobaculia bacterium]|nr:redox-sensing transcriptional repressor Rex [Thermoanaerobaculia bacterium]HUM29516.1 redox-sensing transcriptional repressor Rex [Thermoanaerobaculia bacterium]HXK67899.1 redox-sensing transcriptional repressor Rex [Thermoanaerobaculia bacterium]